MEDILQKIIDLFFAIWPQKMPPNSSLLQTRLIAHRGDHANYKENSFAAISSCIKHQIWGVEFDIRWTKDNIPVLSHDTDLMRVHGINKVIASENYLELKEATSDLCSLEEVIQSFSKKIHYFIELKTQLTSKQENILHSQLKDLQPGTDFHIISLQPEYLFQLKSFPKQSLLLVSIFNATKGTKNTINFDFAGHMGSYLLITKQQITLLKQHKKKIGVGFVKSKRSLFREVNRGVYWLFSNNTLKLQKILNDLQNK